MPKITAAAIPDAGGNTTFVVTPATGTDLYAASRSARDGVHRVLGDGRHQRHREDADADPAASRLNVPALENSFFTKSGLITLSAKKPMTTLGTPASVSMIGFRIRRSRPSVLRPGRSPPRDPRDRDSHRDH